MTTSGRQKGHGHAHGEERAHGHGHGQAIGGHASSGHASSGHESSGHESSGHASSGHASSGQEAPGHGVPTSRGFVATPGAEHVAEPLGPGEGRGKTLFLDAQSGIAGDMMLAALFDLGVPFAVVKEAISSLGLGPIDLLVRTGYAGAIGCSHLSVGFPPQSEERNFSEIASLIQGAALDPNTQDLALRIFRRLAEAESEVHRTTPSQVHFHEVGAVDAIVDIVGVARAITYLGATVKSTPLPLGGGFVTCRHGTLPLPAPATLLCLRGVPTRPSHLDVELVTPTGAAIVATLASEFASWPAMVPERVGWGAGTRGLPDRPNALRMVLGRETPATPPSQLVLLEANIDDMTGERAGEALARLLEAGALDAWIAPVTMKKGRPGFLFSALAPLHLAQQLSVSLLQETSSLGVRQTLVSRLELQREIQEVSTPWGPLRIKCSLLPDGRTRSKPEFADVARIARERGAPLEQVLSEIQRFLGTLGIAERLQEDDPT